VASSLVVCVPDVVNSVAVHSFHHNAAHYNVRHVCDVVSEYEPVGARQPQQQQSVSKKFRFHSTTACVALLLLSRWKMLQLSIHL
jgi:hypothetical protein